MGDELLCFIALLFLSIFAHAFASVTTRRLLTLPVSTLINLNSRCFCRCSPWSKRCLILTQFRWKIEISLSSDRFSKLQEQRDRNLSRKAWTKFFLNFTVIYLNCSNEGNENKTLPQSEQQNDPKYVYSAVRPWLVRLTCLIDADGRSSLRKQKLPPNVSFHTTTPNVRRCLFTH